MIDRTKLVLKPDGVIEFIEWKCPNRCKCEKKGVGRLRYQDSRCKNFPEEWDKPCEEIEI